MRNASRLEATLFDATNGMYASGFSSGAFFADLFI